MTVISRPDPKRWVRRGLAGAAILAAGLAVVAGDPVPSSVTPGAGTAADEIAALDLAVWIRDRRPGLEVVDLRGVDAYATDHLPGAQLPLEEWLATREQETMVVYSQSSAAEARERSRAAGLRPVLALRGGYEAWVAEVLNPSLPLDASPAEAEEFRRVAELSRYFGGQPRRGETKPVDSGSWIRRGC